MTDSNPPEKRMTLPQRRTFAIISHPDAGKTTLTEHMLLRAGAIHLAGQVKSRGDARRARSDWMKIEQQRGISVTSAVMTFSVGHVTFNLLDTPGHEDFSEDTYRTLTAADSAIMVLDAAKGIEAQTLKLFEVCRLRNIPIITFINKVDREGRDPFTLLDQVVEKLAMEVCPMTWPMGMGSDLRGICHFGQKKIFPFFPPGKARGDLGPWEMDDDRTLAHVPEKQRAALDEEMALASGAYATWNREEFWGGALTPVFFGSALRDFGVDQVLQAVADHAPGPQPRATQTRVVQPNENQVTGFVFKVQANMDAKHRDRIAFMRLCSGKFVRGMKLTLSSGKTLAVRNPILFFAQDRELVDEAYPGDIIGIPNHGTIRVGDSLTESESLLFTGIPDFAPEILRRIRLDDPMKAKHLHRALQGLADEGVSQVFKTMLGASWVVGVVGQLQLEVLAARLQSEYNINVDFDGVPYGTARWIDCDDPAELKRFIERHFEHMVTDRDDEPVFLAASEWELNYLSEKFPAIRFRGTSERK